MHFIGVKYPGINSSSVVILWLKLWIFQKVCVVARTCVELTAFELTVIVSKIIFNFGSEYVIHGAFNYFISGLDLLECNLAKCGLCFGLYGPSYPWFDAYFNVLSDINYDYSK